MLSIATAAVIGTAWAVRRGQRQVTAFSRSVEDELERILSSIDGPCFIMDNEGRLVLANEPMHNLVELSFGSLTGLPCVSLFSMSFPNEPICDVIETEKTVEILRRHTGPATVKLKGMVIINKRREPLGALIRLWDPVKRRRENTSEENMEQLWETLLAKQSINLEQKNRELEQSGRELQQLVERIGSIKDQEGIRISRVLSGELHGLLADIRANVACLRDELGSDFENRVDSVLQVIDSAANQVASIIEGIRPSVLDGGHLGEAIEKVAAQFEKVHQIELKTRINVSVTRINIDLSTAIFRIAQESLTNIARHSGASKAQMSLLDTSDGVALVVEDNGRGVLPEELEKPSALGVLGMKERAKSLGGRLDIRNKDDRGCVVSLFVPVHR